VVVKPIISKVSHATVTETVACLLAEVEARGMTLFATIDNTDEARARGPELCETGLVIFADTQIGAQTMQAAPLAGLDLPLTVLVREDRNRTCVSYTALRELQFGTGLATSSSPVSRESTRSPTR
jgi:uncharacterized protein (DUF302 family)